MTVIVWDGLTLAADREAGNSYTHFGRTKKVHRSERTKGLIGFAGSLSVAIELVAWFEGGADPERFPKACLATAESTTKLMHITPAFTVEVYEGSPLPIRFENAQYAIGSGAEAAMAVLMMGGDSRKAIEIASQICNGVGGGCDEIAMSREQNGAVVPVEQWGMRAVAQIPAAGT